MIGALFPDGIVTADCRIEGAGAAHAGLHPEEAAWMSGAGAERRRQFAAGRRCARRALAKLGIADFALLPDAQRVPRWPPGVVGCIAHTGDFCAVAVARSGRYAGLGLDVESAQSLDAAVARRVCSPAERAQLAALPRVPGRDWAVLVFSAKESVYKCYYPLARTPLGFRDVELAIDPGAGAFRARLVRADAPAVAGMRSFRGRFAWSAGLVATAVTLPAPESGDVA